MRFIYIYKVINYIVQLFTFHNLPFVTDIPIRLQSNSKVFYRVEGKRRKMLEYWKNISLSLVCCKINSRVALNRLWNVPKKLSMTLDWGVKICFAECTFFFRKKEIFCLYDAYLWGFILKINSFRIYFYLSNIGWRTKKDR